MHDLISNPLYQAVLANPADDLPRLVLADWLDEQGDSDRADFIRTQIELAKWPEKTRRDFDREAESEARRRLGRLRGQDRDRVLNDAITIRREMDEKYTARRKSLVDRQMKLLWRDHTNGGSNWERWCWAAARDEDGMPVRGNGRGGLVVTPHGSGGLSGEPASCAVSLPNGGMLSQEWHRGFIGHVGVRTWGDLHHITPLVKQYPIFRAVMNNSVPWQNEDGTRSWWMKSEGTTPSLADVPGNVWRLLPKNDGAARYETPVEAYAALSTAILRWSRLPGN